VRIDELTPTEPDELLAMGARPPSRRAPLTPERRCAYQELDGREARAEHVWTRGPAGEMAASLRVLDEGAGGTRARVHRHRARARRG
jgi:predicted GNAT family N-acyltransferase